MCHSNQRHTKTPETQATTTHQPKNQPQHTRQKSQRDNKHTREKQHTPKTLTNKKTYDTPKKVTPTQRNLPRQPCPPSCGFTLTVVPAFTLMLLWFFRLMWFGCCSGVFLCLLWCALVILVLRSFVTLASWFDAAVLLGVWCITVCPWCLRWLCGRGFRLRL